MDAFKIFYAQEEQRGHFVHFLISVILQGSLKNEAMEPELLPHKHNHNG